MDCPDVEKPVAIRCAAVSDAPAIARLFTQLGYPGTADDIATRLHEASADTHVLVAFDNVAVSGVLVLHIFAPLHVARPWAVISSLVEDERARSGGAGAALIAAAEHTAVLRQCAHIELSCSEQRTRAHAFYRTQRFAEVRKRFVKKFINA